MMVTADIRQPTAGFNTNNIMWAMKVKTGFDGVNSSISDYGFTPTRYESLVNWLERLGLIDDFGMGSEVFEQLNQDDPYFDDISSLLILHWRLFSNPTMIAFRWYFGHYTKKINHKSFDECLLDFKKWAKEHEYHIAENTLSKLLATMFRLYAPNQRGEKIDLEQWFDSPFAPLQIVTKQKNWAINSIGYTAKAFRFDMYPNTRLTFFGFLKEWLAKQPGTVEVFEVLYNEHSPARAFNLDENTFMDLIEFYEQNNLLKTHNLYLNENRSKGIALVEHLGGTK